MTNGREAERAESFEAVVRRQGERLIQSLTTVFLDPELAADAAQDAFLQLHRHWDEVTKKGSPDAWLYQVALNRGRDYRRALLRASRLMKRLTDAASVDPIGVKWTPRSELLDVLRTLPVRQRTAVALYYDADCSVADIARIMGISEGAVSSHLHRARLALRNILEAELWT